MWTDGVVIYSPRLDDAASFAKSVEQMLVEALVPQPTLERFHEPSHCIGAPITVGVPGQAERLISEE